MKKDLGNVKGERGETGEQGAVGPRGPQGFPAKVNGIEPDVDGDIVLRAEEIKTASGESVETQLSQKADNRREVIDGNVFSAITQKDGFYLYSGTLDTAPSLLAGTLISKTWDDGFQTLLAIDEHGEMYKVHKSGGVWGVWTRIPTATPPQEFPLPLAAGISPYRSSRYFKRQDETTVISVCIQKSGTSNDLSTMSIATVPVGFRPTDEARADISGQKSDGTFCIGACFVATDGNVSILLGENAMIVQGQVSFVAAPSGPIAYGAPVRMAAARSVRMAILEEPIDKCFCVVDADGNYRELVLVTITHDDDGAIYTPHHYSLKDGEQFVDTQYPTKRPHAGADGFLLPRWDFDAQVWTEAATAEEIAAWEAEHPAPAVPGPSAQDDADSLLIDHEYRLTLLELGVI